LGAARGGPLLTLLTQGILLSWKIFTHFARTSHTDPFVMIRIMPLEAAFPAACPVLNSSTPSARRLEASSDLKHWSDYPAAEASTQTGTNGLSWIRVTPLSSHRFYRAKQMQ